MLKDISLTGGDETPDHVENNQAFFKRSMISFKHIPILENMFTTMKHFLNVQEAAGTMTFQMYDDSF